MNMAMTDFASLLRSGDRRWGFPSEAELAKAELQPLRSDAPQKLQHAGRKDVAFALTAWPTDDYHDDPAEARALQVLRSVLQNRAG